MRFVVISAAARSIRRDLGAQHVRFVSVSARSACGSQVSEGWQDVSFRFGAQWVRFRGTCQFSFGSGAHAVISFTRRVVARK